MREEELEISERSSVVERYRDWYENSKRMGYTFKSFKDFVYEKQMTDCLGVNYEFILADQKKERWLRRHSEKFVEKNKNIEETMKYIEGTKDGHRAINRDMKELMELRHEVIKGKFVQG